MGIKMKATMLVLKIWVAVFFISLVTGVVLGLNGVNLQHVLHALGI